MMATKLYEQRKMEIILTRLLIYLLLLLSFSSFAGGLKDVQDSCSSVKWSQLSCNIIEDRSPYNIDIINRNFLALSDTTDYSHSEILTWVKENASNLNVCQKAAFLKCVSAEYLEYDDEIDASERLSLDDIVYGKKGKCRQFASFYKWLSDEVGITSCVATGGDENDNLHAWNVVKIGKLWTYIEPQSNKNLFYKVPSGLDVSNHDETVGPADFIFP